MRIILLSIMMTGLLVACGSQKQAETPSDMKDHSEMKQHDHAEHTDMAAAEKLIYYTCPMESHKHIHSREPGTCSECNMTLVEGVITSVDKMEYYGCPMEIHSHVRQDEPGRCAECKMELKPMRLKESL